ncbi:type II secretion system protein [Candidatus Gottesmanbacteria bacterium]|nr:type II secretion system protein [Candidatus Gottesmanbacteria bacterium]
MIVYKKTQRGFTLVEVIIALLIFSSLVTMVIINLLNVKHKASLSDSIDTFINNLKSQQLKAMVGDTEGNNTKDNIGIYLTTNKYTDFYGTLNLSSSTNLDINFDDNIQIISTTFPSSQIIFLSGSGDISGAIGNNTITMKNSLSSEQKIITVNKYGIVTSVN